MSYDCSIVNEDGVLYQFPVKKEFQGSIYVVGGNKAAWLSVTYNYAEWIRKALGMSLFELDGKKAAETISILKKGVSSLPDTDDGSSYWDDSGYQTRKALEILLFFAVSFPDGYWKIT